MRFNLRIITPNACLSYLDFDHERIEAWLKTIRKHNIKYTLFTNKLINIIDIIFSVHIFTRVGSNHVKSMIIYSQPGYFFK